MNTHAAEYFDSNYYFTETQEIGRKSWFFLGHVSDFKQEYTFLKPWNFSVIVVNQKSSIKAFLNACPHRGLSFCKEDVHSDKTFIKCKYHGLKFDLNGRQVFPFNNNDLNDIFKLQELEVEMCGKFLFGSLQPDCSLKEYLSKQFEKLSNYSQSVMEKTLEKTKILPINWKFLMENFLDCLHILHVHSNNIGKSGKLPEDDSYQYSFSPYASSLAAERTSLPSKLLNSYEKWSSKRKLKVNGYQHLHAFPNFNISTDFGFYFVHITVVPINVKETILKTSLYVPEGSEFSARHLQYIQDGVDKILDEDLSMTSHYSEDLTYLKNNFVYSKFEKRAMHFKENCIKVLSAKQNAKV